MKFLALLLSIALVFNATGSALPARESSEHIPLQTPEQRRLAKAKAELARRGVGENSRVRVRLRDGPELKGHITQIGQDSFELLTDPDGLEAHDAKERLITISYTDIVKIRGPQSRMTRIGTDIGLTIAVVAVLSGLALLALWDYNRRHRY